MNFGALPPEINSLNMYSGPGSGPLLAAASAWDLVAADLHLTATAAELVISQLSAASWSGPSSQAMAAAVRPYLAWLTAATAHAETTGTQARAAAAAYESAFAMTVPPSVVLANRLELQVLVATNFLGQNTAAIAATEAQYAQMWAQDAAAMYGYAAAAGQASRLPALGSPAQAANPAGTAQQAAATGHDAGTAAGSTTQQALTHLGPATANSAGQAVSSQPAPLAATPFPAQEFPTLADLLGLNALAVVGLAGTGAGLAMAAGAWLSADESTIQILKEQEQVQKVEYDILHAIDLFSPLTPSRPDGYIPPPPGARTPAAALGRGRRGGLGRQVVGADELGGQRPGDSHPVLHRTGRGPGRCGRCTGRGDVRRGERRDSVQPDGAGRDGRQRPGRIGQPRPTGNEPAAGVDWPAGGAGSPDRKPGDRDRRRNPRIRRAARPRPDHRRGIQRAEAAPAGSLTANPTTRADADEVP